MSVLAASFAIAQADGAPPTPKRTTTTAAPIAAPVQQAPAPRWTGGQFGGHGGGSQLGQSFVEPGSNLCPFHLGAEVSGVSANLPGCRETDFAFSGRPKSVTGGVFLGYNLQFGNFVAGIEGDASYKNASTTSSLATVTTVTAGAGAPHTRYEQFNGKQTQKSDGSVRARLGLLITPWLLGYATGGLAVGEVCGSYSYDASVVGAFTRTASGAMSWCDTRVGYTAGGGVEMEIALGWKARLEYRFTDLGTYHKDIPLTAGAGSPCAVNYSCTGNGRVDLNDNQFHTLRLGIGLNF